MYELEGVNQGLFQGTITAKENHEKSVKITSNQTQIQTGYLKKYKCTVLLLHNLLRKTAANFTTMPLIHGMMVSSK
jgi:hypothetical protein